MMIELIIIVGIFLLAMALMDIRHRAMPSILPTTAILIVLVMAIYRNPLFVIFGVLGFVFAWLLYEFKFIQGIVDIKAIIIISLMLTTLNQFFLFMVLLASFGMIYQIILSYILKIKKGRDVPFIPLLLLVYIVLMILIWVI